MYADFYQDPLLWTAEVTCVTLRSLEENIRTGRLELRLWTILLHALSRKTAAWKIENETI